MAQFCEVCGRGPQMSNLRSKSNIATKRRQKVNVQPKKLDGKRISMCTRCWKTKSKVTA